jgi:hypothetical protein
MIGREKRLFFDVVVEFPATTRVLVPAKPKFTITVKEISEKCHPIG